MQLTRAESQKYTSNLYNSTAKKKKTKQTNKQKTLKNGQKTLIDISPKKIYRWITST